MSAICETYLFNAFDEQCKGLRAAAAELITIWFELILHQTNDNPMRGLNFTQKNIVSLCDDRRLPVSVE